MNKQEIIDNVENSAIKFSDFEEFQQDTTRALSEMNKHVDRMNKYQYHFSEMINETIEIFSGKLVKGFQIVGNKPIGITYLMIQNCIVNVPICLENLKREYESIEQTFSDEDRNAIRKNFDYVVNESENLFKFKLK